MFCFERKFISFVFFLSLNLALFLLQTSAYTLKFSGKKRLGFIVDFSIYKTVQVTNNDHA